MCSVREQGLRTLQMATTPDLARPACAWREVLSTPRAKLHRSLTSDLLYSLEALPLMDLSVGNSRH